MAARVPLQAPADHCRSSSLIEAIVMPLTLPVVSLRMAILLTSFVVVSTLHMLNTLADPHRHLPGRC